MSALGWKSGWWGVLAGGLAVLVVWIALSGDDPTPDRVETVAQTPFPPVTPPAPVQVPADTMALEPEAVLAAATFTPSAEENLGGETVASAMNSPGRETGAPRRRYQRPLAFVPINPAALTPSIAAKIEHIRQQFVRELGDTSNPNDPAYAERWDQAQASADDRYRAMFGWQAFNEMTLQRALDRAATRAD
jgi:hypothetical protein